MISVITVSRNAAALIGDCVASVYQQEGIERLAEHVLIDACSSDDTCRVVQHASGGRSRIYSEPDAGLYDAMNKGVRLAAGGVVGFLNSDDLYAHSRVLEKVAACFAEEPGLQLCYSGLCYVARDKPEHIRRRWPARQLSAREISLGFTPPHPTVFMRKELFVALGGFDLSYKIGADSDLLLRALVKAGARHKSVDDCWVLMREGGVSNRSWRSVWLSSGELRRSMRAVGMRAVWWRLLLRYVSKLGQYLPRRMPGV